MIFDKFIEDQLSAFNKSMFVHSSFTNKNGSKYLYISYKDAYRTFENILKIRVSNHAPADKNNPKNVGKYYFICLREDLGEEYNRPILWNALQHIKSFVESKKVIKRVKSRF